MTRTNSHGNWKRGLVVALSLFGSGETVAQQPPAFQQLRNHDLPGDDLRTPSQDPRLKGIDAAACEAACGREPQCQAYTYNTSVKWCFLKSQAGTPLPFAGALSGIRKDAATATVAAPPKASAHQPDRPEVLPNMRINQGIFYTGFSSNGRYLLTGTAVGTAQLWDRASGRLIRNYRGETVQDRVYIFGADISGDGKYVAAIDREGVISVWDALSARLRHTLNSNATDVRFLPDSHLILAGRDILDAESGRPIRRLVASGKPYVVSADGETLATWNDESHSVALVSLRTGQLLRTFAVPSGEVRKILFSPDSKYVVTASSETDLPTRSGDNHVRIYDSSTGQIRFTLQGHNTPLAAGAFTSDGQLLISLDEDGNCRSWKVDSGELVNSIRIEVSDAVGWALAPDASAILSTNAGELMQLWDPPSGKLLGMLGQYLQPITAMDISANGGQLITDSTIDHDADETRRIWDLRNGALASAEVFMAPGFEENLGLSRDRTLAVTGLRHVPDPFADKTKKQQRGQNFPLVLRKTVTKEKIQDFKGHGAASTGVIFIDNDRILSIASDATASLWSVETGKALWTANIGVKDAMRDYKVSAAGSHILIGFFDRAVLLELASGRVLRRFKGPDEYGIAQLDISPDGRRMAAADGNWDNNVRVWDAQSGATLRVMKGHDGAAWAVAFSPDGRQLVSGGVDGMARLWDVASGRPIREFRDVSGSLIRHVSFSADGRRIFTGHGDGAVRVWDAASGALVAMLLAGLDGAWVILTPEGFFASSPGGAGLLHVVNGLEVYSLEQFFQALYRPDLVREKLAGDPGGLVREAALRLDLNRLLASGDTPVVTLISPRPDDRAGTAEIAAEASVVGGGGGIGRIEWRINGVTVAVEDAPAAHPAGQPLRLAHNFALIDGDNEIEVVAYNRSNLIVSRPARALVLGPASPPGTARLHFLAVAVNDYADERFRLRASVPDANALAQALKVAGKDIFADVEVTLLSNSDVSQERLDEVFSRIAGSVRPNDVFIFFVGGHGKTVDGRYYFVPHPFRIEGNRSSVADVNQALIDQGISQDMWQVWFARIKARRSLLLFDTCESGSLTAESDETRALARSAAGDRLAQATGRSILTASASDQDALEGFNGHGLFTYTVLDAFGHADSDGDGRVDVTELGAYVHAQVTAVSDAMGQHSELRQLLPKGQIPQVRVTANFSFAKSVSVLRERTSAFDISSEATHRLLAHTEIRVLPAPSARRVRSLSADIVVRSVKSEGGWTLVARGGAPIGYVATRDMIPLH